MTSLLNYLPILIKKAGDSQEALEQAVFAAWAAVAGEQLRLLTAPVRVERKNLIIAVRDTTWRTQLKRITGHSVFKLNSLLGSPVITKIEFVVNKALVDHYHEPPNTVTFTAPEEQAKPLREPAERIGNPDIRDAFLRAAGKCLDRRAKE